MQDGAAGDPPSIGVAVILANWTGRAAVDGLDYAGAAVDQLDYLFQDVPQTSDGAISHRTDEVQLWCVLLELPTPSNLNDDRSDFVYMVPPFLAYYGTITNDTSILSEAYNQIKLYRNYLMDPDADGMWRHIVLGSILPQDPGHWSTGKWSSIPSWCMYRSRSGNGWAAAGMLRVLATMMHSDYNASFTQEISDLASWVHEIHTGIYQYLVSRASS
jgi:rhamnogalacturonyl hydrolase YesR